MYPTIIHTEGLVCSLWCCCRVVKPLVEGGQVINGLPLMVILGSLPLALLPCSLASMR